MLVIHGSSFWSKKQSTNGSHVLSWEPAGDGDEDLRLWRVFAVYEKQLFTEKMVSVCFMDPNRISEWDENIKVPLLSQQDFSEIWEDRGEVSVSMGVDASKWIDAEMRQNIQSGAQGDSIAEHASVIWQEFDVAMIMPEPYYDQRQYWFKMDTYASNDPAEKHSSVLDAKG